MVRPSPRTSSLSTTDHPRHESCIDETPQPLNLSRSRSLASSLYWCQELQPWASDRAKSSPSRRVPSWERQVVLKSQQSVSMATTQYAPTDTHSTTTPTLTPANSSSTATLISSASSAMPAPRTTPAPQESPPQAPPSCTGSSAFPPPK